MNIHGIELDINTARLILSKTCLMCHNISLTQPKVCQICNSKWGEIIATHKTNYPLMWTNCISSKNNKYLSIDLINRILNYQTIENILFIFDNLAKQA